MLLLSVPWGSLGSGLRMPFLAINFTSLIMCRIFLKACVEHRNAIICEIAKPYLSLVIHC